MLLMESLRIEMVSLVGIMVCWWTKGSRFPGGSRMSGCRRRSCESDRR